MLKMFRRIPVALSSIAAAVINAYDPYMPSVTSLEQINTAEYLPVENSYNSAFINNGTIIGNALDGNYGYFGGSNISIANGGGLNLGTADFTIEMYVFCTAASLTPDSYLFSVGSNGSSGGHYGINIYNGNWRVGSFMGGLITVPAVNVQNRWNHIAMQRSGDTLYFFVNGVMIGSVSVTGISFNATGGALIIGNYFAYSNYNAPFHGFMDRIRITTVARYATSGFTPTLYPMNSNDPQWANTKLAIDFGGGFVDLKGNNVTNNGAIIMIPGKFSNENLYFTGVSSYAQIASAPGSAYAATDDFTVEMLINFPVAPTASGFFLMDNTTNSGGVNISIKNTSIEIGRSFIGTDHSFATTWLPNTWYHVAVIRKNGILYCYINGVKVGSGANTFAYVQGNITLGIGGNLSLMPYKGFMCEFRATKSIARYVNLANISTIEIPTETFKDYRAGDYYWDNTSSLITSTLTDSRAKGFGYSSGVTIDNSIKLFNQSTIKFSSGNIYVNGNGLAIGANDYTFEGWIYPTANDGDRTVFDNRIGIVQGIALYSSLGGKGKLHIYNNGASLGSGSTVLPLNQWSHIAVSRIGTTLYCFLNGKLEFSVTDSGVHLATSFWYGTSVTNGLQPFQGNMSNLRFTYGVGRYRANFNIPVAPYPIAANDSDIWSGYNQLLMHFEGSTITDVTGKTVTSVGSAALSTAQKKFDNSSLYLPGYGNYLSIPNSTAWDFTASDGTIETWTYLPSGYGFSPLIGQSNGGNDQNWWLYVYANGKIGIGRSGVNELTSASGAFVANKWNHIAVTKSGSTVTLYLNGIKVASGTAAYFNTSTNPLYIGATSANAGGATPIYLDEIRISKGICRYTNNFTLSSAKLPDAANGPSFDLYWAYETALLDFEGSEGQTTITDKVRNSVYSAVGTGVKITTSKSRTGNASLYVPNTTSNNCLSAADSALSFGTGDFTVEFYVYYTGNVASYSYMVTNGGSSGNIFSIRLGDASFSNKFQLEMGATGNILSGTLTKTEFTNVWKHVAVCRKNGIVSVFVDGALIASGTNTANLTGINTYLGGYPTNTYGLNGYIDGFRASKVCRYSGPFVPPAYVLPLAA